MKFEIPLTNGVRFPTDSAAVLHLHTRHVDLLRPQLNVANETDKGAYWPSALRERCVG